MNLIDTLNHYQPQGIGNNFETIGSFSKGKYRGEWNIARRDFEDEKIDEYSFENLKTFIENKINYETIDWIKDNLFKSVKLNDKEWNKVFKIRDKFKNEIIEKSQKYIQVIISEMKNCEVDEWNTEITINYEEHFVEEAKVVFSVIPTNVQIEAEKQIDKNISSILKNIND